MQEPTVPQLGGDGAGDRHRASGPAEPGDRGRIVLGLAAGGHQEDVVGQRGHAQDPGSCRGDGSEGVLVHRGDVTTGVDHEQGAAPGTLGRTLDVRRARVGIAEAPELVDLLVVVDPAGSEPGQDVLECGGVAGVAADGPETTAGEQQVRDAGDVPDGGGGPDEGLVVGSERHGPNRMEYPGPLRRSLSA
uniref:Uncharacterized protein n=1 Tax=Neobacillus citreus TaxID=2833578 RepID=A0A942SW60_9BACI